MKRLTRRNFVKGVASGMAGVATSSLLTGCASMTGKQGKDAFNPIKFLSVNDMHLVDEKSTTYPKKVIQSMNKEGGELVLVCGDLAKDGKRSELEIAKKVLDELSMPYYPVVGNHDALYRGEKEEELFKEIFALKSNSYHVVKNGVSFFGIDHGCGKNMRKNQVKAETMTWIKQTLATIPNDRPIIFFSHYPFAKGVRYRTKNADEVQALFKGKRLLAMISGHFHGNTERIENGILMTTTACSSGTRGNHDGTKAKGYRVFTVDATGKITTEFKEVTP